MQKVPYIHNFGVLVELAITVCTPEEKAAAEKKLASFKNCYSPYFQSKVINETQSRMLIDSDYVEHNMNEELEDK